MNLFIHGRLGHFLMNEAGADGGQGGGTVAAATGEPQSNILGGDQGAQGQQQQQAGDANQQTQEGQQQAGEKKEGEGEQGQKPVVPDAYTFKDLPEGYAMSDQQLAEVSPLFKELGLTQEQADKLVAFDAKRTLAAEQAGLEQRQGLVTGWEKSLREDAAFGGANFDANVGVAQKALAQFGTPELSTMLKESGLGSHPEVVRLFHRIGQQLAEGQLHSGSGNNTRKSNEEVFYGKK
ncbi:MULTISPECIES: hypothetical protein [Pseudomonas]|uniref:hypothetical protein n=1 Tax=Pseudomonas TaxID=286 RepID=UPI0002A158BB|nr:MULTISPECIES: hypothetical protein [Pseudomonas]AGA72646.1 hypothetical protein B479_08670 [Pseudomonas putida HB3267]MCE0757188.1 hypothetical protein [Pseudomonas asiatica]MCE0946436.1 hypothetical protein [Pseudomonas asiatica]MCE0955999.1 hypothetical protein [Pseudomonas asiatica]MCE1031044.1 hypothetical protein [Pseudomonas asiatica]